MADITSMERTEWQTLLPLRERSGRHITSSERMERQTLLPWRERSGRHYFHEENGVADITSTERIYVVADITST